MNLQQRIENKIGKGTDINKDYLGISFILHKELHIGYADLMKMPIPYVFDMMSNIKRIKEAEKKASRRRR